MLVDSMEGEIHRAYGALPNMSWIINRAGKIVYKADWTDVRTIRTALEQLEHEREARKGGARITPYYMEMLPQRVNAHGAFLTQLLEIPGPRAVREFVDAIAHNGGESSVKGLRNWMSEHMPDPSAVE